eukprot:scaffold8681_cov200-Amphora_coffeaeformis.AAC.9
MMVLTHDAFEGFTVSRDDEQMILVLQYFHRLGRFPLQGIVVEAGSGGNRKGTLLSNHTTTRACPLASWPGHGGGIEAATQGSTGDSCNGETSFLFWLFSLYGKVVPTV